jgi:hypothetical protein
MGPLVVRIEAEYVADGSMVRRGGAEYVLKTTPPLVSSAGFAVLGGGTVGVFGMLVPPTSTGGDGSGVGV